MLLLSNFARRFVAASNSSWEYEGQASIIVPHSSKNQLTHVLAKENIGQIPQQNSAMAVDDNTWFGDGAHVHLGKKFG
jgi:hypothetical protein